MSINKNNLLKNTIIIGIGTICTKILSFIMVPLYTMWLTPEEYGEYDLIISYLTLLIPFITMQLEQAVFRFSLKKKEDSRKYFVNAFLITLINILVINVLCLIVLKKSIFKYSFILYFDTYSIFVLLSEYLRGNDKLKNYSFYNIITSIIIVVFNIVLVYKLRFGAVGLMYSYALSYLIVDIVIFVKERIIYSLRKKNVSKTTIKEMLKYSLPMIPNGISWWITNVSDRTIIRIVLGSFYNGLYAISCKIPTIMSLVYSIFNLSWQQTVITTYDEEKKEEYYNNVFKKLILFLFSCGFLIITLLPTLYKYLIAKEYFESIKYVPFALMGAIYLSLGQFLSGILLAQNNTKKIGYTTTISAIINIIINILFMEKFGLMIASISTMVSYIYLFFRRYMMISLLHNKKSLAMILSFSIFLVILSAIVLNTNNLLFYLILCLSMFVLAIVFNKELIQVLIKNVENHNYKK